MAIELSSDRVICSKCGRAYGKRQSNFSTSYASSHKGIGFLPICKTCVDAMYNSYLSQCHNTKDAVRQMCRKLDLYWNDRIYELVEKKSSPRSIMSLYVTKVNSTSYAGKCYDDTLSDEGTLWSFASSVVEPVTSSIEAMVNTKEVDEEIKAFWGSGYTPDMYDKLEQRRNYYISKLPKGVELDVGAEALIRQICNLEVTIAQDSVSGKSIDKSVNSLNTLLGSLNLKPAQKKEDINESDSQTPFGVWIHRFENLRPIPEEDTDEDADGIVKFVLTWLYGHLGKMLGIKNVRSKLYDEAVESLKVTKPEYEDESDDDFLYDIFSNGSSEYELNDDEDSFISDDIETEKEVVE